MIREFCDKCDKEIKNKAEMFKVSVSQGRMESEHSWCLFDMTLCRSCVQGYIIDINALDGVGQ